MASPSSRRRTGREEYFPHAIEQDRDMFNPFNNDLYRRDFNDGWKEAEDAFLAEPDDEIVIGVVEI